MYCTQYNNDMNNYKIEYLILPNGKAPIIEWLNKIILLINGGDKSKQSKDIEKAHELLEQWRIKND